MIISRVFVIFLTFVSTVGIVNASDYNEVPIPSEFTCNDNVQQSCAEDAESLKGVLGSINISIKSLSSILADESISDDDKELKFKAMFAAGLKVDDKCDHGLTPMHYLLAKFPKIDLLDFLLKNNANINARTNAGSTPLHFAIRHKAGRDVIKFLLDKGSDLLAIDQKQRSISHYLFYFSSPKDICLDILQRSQFKHINLRDSFDYTPLTALVRYGNDIDALQEVIRGNYDKIDFSVHIFPQSSRGILYNRYKFFKTQSLLSFLHNNGFLLPDSKPLIDPFYIGKMFINEGNVPNAKFYLGVAVGAGNSDAVFKLLKTYYNSCNDFFASNLIIIDLLKRGDSRIRILSAVSQCYCNNITSVQSVNLLNSIKDDYKSVADFLKLYSRAEDKIKLLLGVFRESILFSENESYFLTGRSNTFDDIEFVSYNKNSVQEQIKRAIAALDKNRLDKAMFWLFVSVNSYLYKEESSNAIPIQLIYMAFVLSDGKIKDFIELVGKAFPGYKEVASSLFYNDELYRKVESVIMQLDLNIGAVNKSNIDGIVQAIIAYGGQDCLSDDEKKSESQIKMCLEAMFF